MFLLKHSVSWPTSKTVTWAQPWPKAAGWDPLSCNTTAASTEVRGMLELQAHLSSLELLHFQFQQSLELLHRRSAWCIFCFPYLFSFFLVTFIILFPGFVFSSSSCGSFPNVCFSSPWCRCRHLIHTQAAGILPATGRGKQRQEDEVAQHLSGKSSLDFLASDPKVCWQQ